MIKRGVPPTAPMFDLAKMKRDSGTLKPVNFAHLAYLDSLCDMHGGAQGLSENWENIKRIMKCFLETLNSNPKEIKSVGDLGEVIS
jgi:hypothetical protein